ncbi:type I restriction endonuclease subunit R [Methylosarcina fibrata]|uniref:type I restriction endonuclease subunit R n=1 Tax=Methylosarcina fibrata TaxID=105972 RepID=UPI000374B5E7|nr:DEAD/DEAH box helicase family protein [Methylosarcina fibrata]
MKKVIMQSVNFEFIRPHRPEIADLGGFAEYHLYTDPSSSLIKLRALAEQAVKSIYHLERLPRLYRPQLIDLINDASFQEVANKTLITNLNYLRIQGNGPAHGEKGDTRTAAIALGVAQQIVAYLAVRYYGLSKEEIPQFQEPVNVQQQTEVLKRDNQHYQKLLKEQSEALDALLAEVDQLRTKASYQESNAADRLASASASQQVSDALQWNEAQTRKLMIDTLLAKAGWDVKDSRQVALEWPVDHQPTVSGKGKADYVLWDDNSKPLAVIEAKKASETLSQGREQARYYADGLEKMSGQRPVIFYTNGYEIGIWDDVQYNSARTVYGFYGKESLKYLFYQRQHRNPDPEQLNPDATIAGRPYQIEAIKSVVAKFQQQRRKALIVQATGTGKTRVAIAICELLLRSGWGKRILFLCDRNELRKQGADAFKTFLPSEPRCIIGQTQQVDTNARIYVSTYPAMMNRFEQFDIGFFDLIIADESHRSIYNKYRDLFIYFDALQLGLTATPVKFISRNTYALFGCENQDPTFEFGLEQAINNVPPYLVPFKAKDLTTNFLREGIKWANLTEEQREQLQEQDDNAESYDYAGKDIGKAVFNKDTDRIILQNLMEKGIKDDTGALVGKSIIFARSQRHSELLQETFKELYPQHGEAVCKVIHNKVPRVEALIDEFKEPRNNFRIAISVDMLDTGIDVPEVVNLVFAKPVKSWVKFWQMIGRGTRLCENLFGPGQHKTEFLIFDHYGNFKYFEEEYEEAETGDSKSILHHLFDARLQLAQTAAAQNNRVAFDLAIQLLKQDINDLPENSIQVRNALKQVHEMQQEGVLEAFTPATQQQLLKVIAPLMSNRKISDKDAIKLDRLIAEMQDCLLKKASCFQDKQMEFLSRVDRLAITIKAVRAKDELIAAIQKQAWWQDADCAKLENLRLELRGIMKYQQGGVNGSNVKQIDVVEDKEQVQYNDVILNLKGTEAIAYRFKIKTILDDLLDSSLTLQKIRSGEAVTDSELQQLSSLVLTQNPGIDLNTLKEFFPDSAGQLHVAIRALIGLEPEKVEAHFTDFLHRHERLTAIQVRFLNLLKSYIANNGFITVEKLYAAPFSTLHAEGIDGIFKIEQADELFALLQPFMQSQPVEQNIGT